MVYNTTFMNNLTSAGQYTAGVNTASGGLFFLVIFIVAWFIMFVPITFRRSFEEGVTFASFVCTVLGVFLWANEYLAGQYPIATAVMSLIGIFILIFNKQ